MNSRSGGKTKSMSKKMTTKYCLATHGLISPWIVWHEWVPWDFRCSKFSWNRFILGSHRSRGGERQGGNPPPWFAKKNTTNAKETHISSKKNLRDLLIGSYGWKPKQNNPRLWSNEVFLLKKCCFKKGFNGIMLQPLLFTSSHRRQCGKFLLLSGVMIPPRKQHTTLFSPIPVKAEMKTIAGIGWNLRKTIRCSGGGVSPASPTTPPLPRNPLLNRFHDKFCAENLIFYSPVSHKLRVNEVKIGKTICLFHFFWNTMSFPLLGCSFPPKICFLEIKSPDMVIFFCPSLDHMVIEVLPIGQFFPRCPRPQVCKGISCEISMEISKNCKGKP